MTSLASASERLHAPLKRAAREAPILGADEERTLLVEAQAGSQRATEKLVLAYLRIVLAVAPIYRRAGVGLDDLVSEGVLGLLEAIGRFDVSRDNRFGTYARWWVRARLARYVGATRSIVLPPSTRLARRVLQSHGRVLAAETFRLGRAPTRGELAEALEVEEDELAALEPVLGTNVVSLSESPDGTRSELEDEAPSPEEHLERSRSEVLQKAHVEKGLAALSERERYVLVQRFALDEPASLAELGAELSVSRERVRQLQQRASEKFRARLRGEGSAL